MTYEELKKEANKLGYKLIKKTEPIKRLPCTCGCKMVYNYYSSHYCGYKCRKCGRMSVSPNKNDKVVSQRQKTIDWNNMIKGEQR